MNQQSVRNVVLWRVTTGLLGSYVLAWGAVALFVAGVGSVHAGSLAIVHGNLLDVERRNVVADAIVMMTDGRIVQVGKSSAVRVPPEAEVDARGKRADLVVLDRNPLEDVSYLRYVPRVVNRATLFDPQSLIDRSSEALVQQQVNAYNSRDIEAFLEPYAEGVQVYIYPGQRQYTGKEAMRTRYRTMFEKTPQLHCEIVERIVLGNVVIDQERITGRAEGPLRVVAIYTVENGKISRVEFVR